MVGRWIKHWDKSSKDKDKIRTIVIPQLAGLTEMPIEGAVELHIDYIMQIPKSLSKRKRIALVGCPHISKGDIDNILKMTLDALVGLLYVDDRQIYSISAKKVYGNEPRTEISWVKV